MSGEKKRVLVVGGTGYLGQHLLQEFSVSFDLAFTYHTNLPQLLLDSVPCSLAFRVDLQTGEGFNAIAHSFGQVDSYSFRFFEETKFVKQFMLTILCVSFFLKYQPDVVVNCAALSIPRACEADPAAAMSINVPSSLIQWLSSLGEKKCLLIHLSTDQVYEGVKSFYKEVDETKPVNVYGKSKVAAEQFIKKNFSNYAILRSSIIFGPQTISPVPKSLPIQWIESVLSKGDKVEFFDDEFRCPVYVKDIVKIIQALSNRWLSEGKQMKLLLNAGGPNRVSRVQMAEAVAHVRGYDNSLIKQVSASSVNRGVQSPADISMDISKLVETLNISPISFEDGVKLTLEAKASS